MDQSNYFHRARRSIQIFQECPEKLVLVCIYIFTLSDGWIGIHLNWMRLGEYQYFRDVWKG